MEKIYEYDPETRKYREIGPDEIQLAGNVFYWDTETTGLDWMTDRIFAHSFGDEDGKFVYIVVNREKDPATNKYVVTESGPATEKIIQVLNDPDFQKYIYNAKFDGLMAIKEGAHNCLATSTDAYILMRLFPKYFNGYKLKEDIAVDFLGMGIEARDEVDEFFKGGPKVDRPVDPSKYIVTIQPGLFSSSDDRILEKYKVAKPKKKEKAVEKKDKEYLQLPDEILIPYAGEDIVLLRATVKKAYKDAGQHYETIKQLLDIELYLQRQAIPAMEICGCAINPEVLLEAQPIFRAKAEENLIEFRRVAGVGPEFDHASGDALRDLFYVKFAEPIKNYTKAAKKIKKYELLKLPFAEQLAYASTDKWALGKMSHPAAKVLVRYNFYNNIAEDFIPNLVDNADENNIIHASFNQLGAISGRLSCSQPNLENIPNPDEGGENVEGRVLRRAIVARPGYKILSIDQSQIEYRIFAHYLESEDLINGFKQGEDFHEKTAKMMNVTRKIAKKINFGLVYGMGPAGLADQLGLTEKEGYALYDQYFEAIPEVKSLREQVTNIICGRGYVRTIMGRRRYLTKKMSYIGINAIVQGSAADIFKKNTMDIHMFLVTKGYKTRIINLVHDEILFELHDDEHHIVKELQRIMASGAPMLKVPLDTNAEIGPNWDEMTEFKYEELPKSFETCTKYNDGVECTLSFMDNAMASADNTCSSCEHYTREE